MAMLKKRVFLYKKISSYGLWSESELSGFANEGNSSGAGSL
jgi:hypothetical protein